MVLQGHEEGFSPPFDAPLFGASFPPSTPGTEYEIEYEDCEAVTAVFSTSTEVRDLLPEGVEPLSDPPTAGVILAHYPFSTVGPYHEFISVVQVADARGEMAYYIPYIYVTNDAALAAGRELAGAPKKLATIDLVHEGDQVRGTLERPEGRRLFEVSAKPEERAGGGLFDTLFPPETTLLSVRHLPPIEGGDGLTQLVRWYADMDFHSDGDGNRKAWTGPTQVSYGDHSAIDPVDRLPVREFLMGAYMKFDMRLGVTEVQREWQL